MPKNNAQKANAKKNKKAKKAASLSDAMTNDKYFAVIVANEVTARLFFLMFLPLFILEQLDLATLKTMFTRDVDANGVESVGDIYFVVDVKNRVGKTRERAVFAIATEHKTDDDPFVSIQLLKYSSALLNRMRKNKDFFADENGRLPTPYVVVFSQDERPKERPVKLGDVLWTLEGLEGTVPNFDYQTIYASQISLDVIKKCEPVMRMFLHLTQIANKKHTREEDVELAETFRQILEAPVDDERAKQCAIASMNYYKRLQQRRPGMPTLHELRKEIEKQKGEPMEDGLSVFFEKEFAENRKQGMQISIYNTIYGNLHAKYGKDSVSERLKAKLDAVNYYPALEEIQLASWMTPSIDAFKRKVAKIVNKYKDEIQEIRR